MDTLDFSADEWNEIYEALGMKIKAIENGELGPEETRGANTRWIADLEDIRQRIELSGAL